MNFFEFILFSLDCTVSTNTTVEVSCDCSHNGDVCDHNAGQYCYENSNNNELGCHDFRNSNVENFLCFVFCVHKTGRL